MADTTLGGDFAHSWRTLAHRLIARFLGAAEARTLEQRNPGMRKPAVPQRRERFIEDAAMAREMHRL